MAYTILGGRLSAPVDLQIHGDLPVSMETVASNIEQATARDLPGIPRLSRVGRKLLVIGGGPSIGECVADIRAGAADPNTDIWAVNGAWRWCAENGIDATFFAVDPHPIVLEWMVAANGEKPAKAIVSVACDPAVFDALAGGDVIALRQGAEGLRGGSSTAGLAPHLAMLMGYHGVVLFGCESSYQIGRSHAYQHENRTEELIVVADGTDFLTAPDYMMQARELATFIHEVGLMSPGYLTEQSGGLLRALVNDMAEGREMRIKWISDAMVAGLRLQPAAVATDPNVPARDAIEQTRGQTGEQAREQKREIPKAAE